MALRVLVADDDRKIAETLRLYLERDGFEVLWAGSGAEALATARATAPDFVILDVMMPRGDGLHVCEQLRAYSSVPILMLTARAAEEDRLRGLELGADDYVIKPFSAREVVARVRAILRRSEPRAVPAPGTTVRCGDITVDRERHEAFVAGVPVTLTPTQFKLLEVLAESPGRVFSRGELAARALAGGADVIDRTVDAHVMNLRRRLDAANGDAGESRIATVFGVGYRMAPR